MDKIIYIPILFLILTSFKGAEQLDNIVKSQDYALFFAIDQYDDWTDLKYPVSDATTIAGELKKNYGFQTEIVKNPTRNQIYDKLEAYRNLSLIHI